MAQHAVADALERLTPNLSLLYHRNVRPIDIYLARLILEAAGATMSFVFLVLFFSFVGWLRAARRRAASDRRMAHAGVVRSSLALFLGALVRNVRNGRETWHPAAYILFPLSGAAFLVDALPEAAQKFVLLLPMVHGVEFLREGYFGSQITAHYDLAYMALWNIALTLFGLAQVRKVSRIVVPE